MRIKRSIDLSNKLDLPGLSPEAVGEWIKANNQPLDEQSIPKISKDLDGGSIDYPAENKIIEETELKEATSTVDIINNKHD